MAKRLKGMGQAKYQNDGNSRTSGPGFGVTVHHDALTLPFRWRKPVRVFVNSMSDLFHEAISDGFIGSVFDVMAQTPQHTYQILTKRHARMRSLLRRWEAAGWTWRRDDMLWCGPVKGPLPNVWLGVSAENQKWADIRVPALLGTPAARRFVSAEPLLGPIDFRHHFAGHCPEHDFPGGFCVQRRHSGVQHLDWIIAGGESGPGVRPCELGWIEGIVDQCHEAGVPVFVKQFGSVLGREFGAGSHGADIEHWPAYLQHRHFPDEPKAVPA